VSDPLPLVDREPRLDLSVGALVVYGSHGIGRVSARSPEKLHSGAATVIIEFDSGLSVILPLERAEVCLRPIAGPSELDSVRAVLSSTDIPAQPPGQARTRATRSKIGVGDPVGLAEVVRDSVERQRRSAPGSTRSSAEQELYRQARRLLVAELVRAADIDEAGADSWIDDQLHRETRGDPAAQGNRRWPEGQAKT
jgi:RNA polymerase-interacting CarD/CdnL/TRCF family regulator